MQSKLVTNLVRSGQNSHVFADLSSRGAHRATGEEHERALEAKRLVRNDEPNPPLGSSNRTCEWPARQISNRDFIADWATVDAGFAHRGGRQDTLAALVSVASLL